MKERGSARAVILGVCWIMLRGLHRDTMRGAKTPYTTKAEAEIPVKISTCGARLAPLATQPRSTPAQRLGGKTTRQRRLTRLNSTFSSESTPARSILSSIPCRSGGTHPQTPPRARREAGAGAPPSAKPLGNDKPHNAYPNMSSLKRLLNPDTDGQDYPMHRAFDAWDEYANPTE